MHGLISSPRSVKVTGFGERWGEISRYGFVSSTRVSSMAKSEEDLEMAFVESQVSA